MSFGLSEGVEFTVKEFGGWGWELLGFDGLGLLKGGGLGYGGGFQGYAAANLLTDERSPQTLFPLLLF